MPVELIAEVASSHGGDLALAKEFIHRFAEAGADWVKFQHTRIKHLRPDDPQYAWFKQAEFSVEQFAELKAECEQAGTKFLTTVFNGADVSEVRSLGLDTVKIGSGEAVEWPVVEAVHGAFSRIFISLGIADYGTADRLWRGFSHNVRTFHCVSRYPHPPSCAHSGYGFPQIGYSDHSIGLEGCQVALIDGARIVEKHVSLPNQARPIRPWEATVEEFKEIRAFADEDPSRMIGRWQYGN